MQEIKRRGSTDRPVDDFKKDEFEIQDYIEGLAEFIVECETPMTIAVQGDWGCGKTSMMNMVRQYLKQNKGIVDVWFNTWQFSQFNMDDCLVVTFLNHLIKQMSARLPEDSEEKKEISGKIKPIMKAIAVGMTKQFAGENIGGIVEGVIDLAGEKKEENFDFADQIFELKESFQKIIRKVADSEDKRVVVFIDDLDRLQPMRAVELLEVLKLFVDCDKCVFVMAIDTSVVFQGIREKYGRDMSNEKAQSFFDKMIQLPFKMPTAYYQLNKLLERLLDFLQDDAMSVGERKQYMSIIREVTDGNPRTIKRLANAVLLVDKVAVRRNLYDEEAEKVQSMIHRILVVLACMQLRYEPVYSFLVNNITYGHMKRILEIKLPERTDANRGEILVNSFYKIGLSAKVNSEDLVFYNIMYLFIELSRDFVRWFKEQGNIEGTAIKRLMQVVSLNNIRETSRENTMVSVVDSEISEISIEDTFEEAEKQGRDNILPDTYVGMLYNGKAMAAYNLMTEKRVYPRISSNMNYSDNAELKEYRKKRVKPQESYLFNKLDEVLREHYDVEAPNKLGEEERFIYKYCKRYGRYEEFRFSLCFVASEKSIEFTQSGAMKSDIAEMFDHCKKLVEAVKKEYERLQMEYSKVIFPDSALNSIDEERDDEGQLQKLRVAFVVESEVMANLLIEYLVNVALCLDKLQTSDSYWGLADTSLIK